MTCAAFILILGLAAVAATPTRDFPRIVGGAPTTVEQYPFAAALLASWGSSYWQSCGGSIINTHSVLSAAHCFYYLNQPTHWRIRVGSTWANSGGTVHNTAQIIPHPNYSANTQDNDFAILRISGNFVFNTFTAAASIAGANYNLADNQPVWAIGWGTTSWGGSGSEQLRHVQVWAINQNTCKQRYANIRLAVTDNMLCSGWLDNGGRDQCQGDSGGPLIHKNIIVGVCSWGYQCAHSYYPGVNSRVSKAANWIVANA